MRVFGWFYYPPQQGYGVLLPAAHTTMGILFFIALAAKTTTNWYRYNCTGTKPEGESWVGYQAGRGPNSTAMTELVGPSLG
eukprot:scaffold298934_cov59-Attheya_sp.AAC.2